MFRELKHSKSGINARAFGPRNFRPSLKDIQEPIEAQTVNPPNLSSN